MGDRVALMEPGLSSGSREIAMLSYVESGLLVALMMGISIVMVRF